MHAASSERKTLYILLLILLSEGAFVMISVFANPHGFIRFLGCAPGQAGPAIAWCLAAAVAAAYVWSASTIAEVRHYLVRLDLLKASQSSRP